MTKDKEQKYIRWFDDLNSEAGFPRPITNKQQPIKG